MPKKPEHIDNTDKCWCGEDHSWYLDEETNELKQSETPSSNK